MAREEEARKLAAQVGKTLKEGERILGPTRRPDGTLRKPIRIRAGYVPQDEVAIYQSKGALLKKEMESLEGMPPGSDPSVASKPKTTKSAKRNERKKEKRLQQASLDKDLNKDKDSSVEDLNQAPAVEVVTSELNNLNIATNSSAAIASSDLIEPLGLQDPVPDIDKKIRALKKKIRLAEAQKQKNVQGELKPEQLVKLAKLEDWRKELKLLEDEKN
ncbi:Mago-bind domain-containing protein [Heracleum sosnowskyi]|uniref:Mago-bind domain-containing protein n=1 Tax=Heracleum sosnowskyi TaxID=360622 RepID=A0AAD8JIV8_9APIA|nr:Mago-bind domain-containing protein [Heracleum sosnowskyi]